MERLGEVEGERLAGAVGGLVGERLHPGGGGDGDHAAAAALDHRRDERAGEDDDRLAVDPDHLRLALGGELGEAAAEAEAGVVDQEVDVGAEGRDLPGELVGVRAEIAGDDVGGDRELVGQLL